MDYSHPQEVSDVQMAFPGCLGDLIPPEDEIPEQFWRHNGTVWNEFQSDWFFGGLDEPAFYPKDGIDPEMAYRHLATIQGSFEPAHEHKEAAVAYLASLWFDKVKTKEKTYK
jgi:hypothetical protein